MGYTRTRTSGALMQPPNFSWLAGRKDAPTQYWLVYPEKRGFVKSMTDVVTPNFQKMKADGGVISNAMTFSSTQLSGTNVSGGWEHPTYNGTGWVEGYSFPIEYHGEGPDQTFLSDSLAQNAAVNSAHAGVNPNYSMIAVTLMEIDKTREMFAGVRASAAATLGAMNVAIRSLRGRKNTVRAQREAVQAIANTWLQARYGWLPLVYDINGMVDALHKPYHPRYTSRGQSELSSNTSGTLAFAHHGTFGSQWSSKRSTKYRAGILYEDAKGLTASLSSRLGLSISDALTVPWELVRLSFVVDWFIDVGDWLRAVSPKPGCNTLASWLTTEQTVEYSQHSFYANCTDGWFFTGGGGSFSKVLRVKQRSAIPSPILPGYGSGLSTNRSIDAAMLTLQSLKGALKWGGFYPK